MWPLSIMWQEFASGDQETLNGIVCDATFFNFTTQKLELVLPLEVGRL